MNRKCVRLVEKRPNCASVESRIKDVIRSLQEVEKVLKKVDKDRKESASSSLKRIQIKKNQTVEGECVWRA